MEIVICFCIFLHCFAILDQIGKSLINYSIPNVHRNINKKQDSGISESGKPSASYGMNDPGRLKKEVIDLKRTERLSNDETNRNMFF